MRYLFAKTISLRISIVCWALLPMLLNPTNVRGATTIEFVAVSPYWITTEKEAVFYLKASGVTVSSLHCWISSLNPERGDPGPRDSVECKAPDNLAPGPVGELSLKLSPSSVLKRGTYSAVLQVLGTDQSGTAVSQIVE